MKLTKKVLLNIAKPVKFDFPWQNQQLADELLSLMRQHNGLGLAAPQCGINRRLFVMEIQGKIWQCFNPEIEESSADLVEYDEGCLSFPGEHCIINRPEWIQVRYQDYQGNWQNEKLSSLPARCFQHELDHLDGITMWERNKEQYAEQS